jgi:hypothetical protein
MEMRTNGRLDRRGDEDMTREKQSSLVPGTKNGRHGKRHRHTCLGMVDQIKRRSKWGQEEYFLRKRSISLPLAREGR